MSTADDDPADAALAKCCGGECVPIPQSVVKRCGTLSHMPERNMAEELGIVVPFTVSEMDMFVRMAGVLGSEGEGSDPDTGVAMDDMVAATCVADFLADTSTVDWLCAKVGKALAGDIELPLGTRSLSRLPPACLEMVATHLDRDSAAEFVRLWDVCGGMPIHTMAVGGLPVCHKCVRACVRSVSRAAGNAMGTIVEEQRAAGTVFDLEGQLLDDFLIDMEGENEVEFELHGLGNENGGDDLLAEFIAFATGEAAEQQPDESSNGSDPSDAIDAWMDVTGLAHIDPQGFVDTHFRHLVQHERWGRELERVWSRQNNEVDHNRAASPPPIARAALIVSVGTALSRSGELGELDFGACVACTLPGALAHVAAFVESLAVPFAARRALLDLLANGSEYAVPGRATRRNRRDPERIWKLECADVATVCALGNGSCQGCGLRACDGSLNCAQSLGLTRRTRLCMAPSIRRFEANARIERADRLARKIPPPSRSTRRRRKARDGRLKCVVCRNVLPKAAASPLVCHRCARRCRREGCHVHFPSVQVQVDRRFAQKYPPPLLRF